LETEIKPELPQYVEKAEFPEFMIEKFRKNGAIMRYIKAPYGVTSSMML